MEDIRASLSHILSALGERLRVNVSHSLLFNKRGGRRTKTCMHSLTIHTHTRGLQLTAARLENALQLSCERCGDALDSADGTDANRSCGHVRSMRSRPPCRSDWPRSSPALARVHTSNCFEICRYIMCLIMTVIITLLTGGSRLRSSSQHSRRPRNCTSHVSEAELALQKQLLISITYP